MALIISRQKDQEILIGEPPNQVRVVVVEIRPGDKVRLGFVAPRHMQISRDDAIHKTPPPAKFYCQRCADTGKVFESGKGLMACPCGIGGRS